MHLVHFTAKALDGYQHGFTGAQHLAAFVRQGKAGPAALAQAHAQSFLQVAHVQADGRAGDAQHTFRTGEAAAFGYGLEHAQQPQIEITYLVQGCFFCHA
ncbi:hypothetical protein D3C80_1428900 [compost metagenome]